MRFKKVFYLIPFIGTVLKWAESIYYRTRYTLDEVNTTNSKIEDMIDRLIKLEDNSQINIKKTEDLLEVVLNSQRENNSIKESLLALVDKVQICVEQDHNHEELLKNIKDMQYNISINTLKNINDRVEEIKRGTQASVITSANQFNNYYKLLNNANILKSTPRVHFVRCLDTRNTGDMNCGPDLYFQEFIDKYTCFFHNLENVCFDIIEKNDWVIIGGGGLFENCLLLQSSINRILARCEHVISWGTGHNIHTPGSMYDWNMEPAIDYNKFYLFTSRDWNYEEDRFCPCVSCMMPMLSDEYDLKKKIGIIEHHEISINEFEFPRIKNTYPVEAIIKFIGESEVILTSTYHGAYWALLMQKKVILYKPFSSRFGYWKYKPTLYSGGLEKDIKLAITYPQVLEEYRELNINFKNEIITEIERLR